MTQQSGRGDSQLHLSSSLTLSIRWHNILEVVRLFSNYKLYLKKKCWISFPQNMTDFLFFSNCSDSPISKPQSYNGFKQYHVQGQLLVCIVNQGNVTKILDPCLNGTNAYFKELYLPCTEIYLWVFRISQVYSPGKRLSKTCVDSLHLIHLYWIYTER